MNKIVIHQLVKEQHEPIRPSVIRDSVLPSADSNVQTLVTRLLEVYDSRYSASQYGVFAEPLKIAGFPRAFAHYSKQNNPSDDEFLAMTRVAMECLYEKASHQSAASGGYILFVDYGDADQRRFLVVMVKEKSGLRVDRDLQLKELSALDLERIHQGAKIHLPQFLACSNPTPVKQEHLSYLSFVSPNASKETAGYFVSALGCEAGLASKKATDTVLDRALSLFRETPDLVGHRDAFRSELIECFINKGRDKVSVNLDEIAHLVRQHIPIELASNADHLVNSLLETLNGDECQVPFEFSVNLQTIKRHTQIKGQSTSWRLSFERSSLGASPDASIYYDQQRKTLTIRDLPAALQNEIESELEDGGVSLINEI